MVKIVINLIFMFLAKGRTFLQNNEGCIIVDIEKARINVLFIET